MSAVTGTSAVNADGEILVFCELEARDLDSFTVSDREMTFLGEDGDPVFSATFGPLTVEAARARGRVVVCFSGEPRQYREVSASHGL